MFPYRSRREQYAMGAICGVVLLAIGFVGAARMRQPAPLTIQSVPYSRDSTPAKTLPHGAISRTPDSPNRSSPGANPSLVPETPSEIVVDVVGAVQREGIERLKGDARVADAIRAAGGTVSDADLERVNLAAKLRDEDFLLIPHKDGAPKAEQPAPPPPDPVPHRGRVLVGGTATAEPAAGPSSRATSGKTKAPAEPVNLNLATAEQLETLPGVGPAIAQKIIDYRREHGAFTSVDELSAIKGLGEKKRARLLPYLRL